MLPFSILGLFFIALTALGWYFSEKILNIRSKSVEETYQIELEAGRIDPTWLDGLPKEEVQIKSRFGYDLYGWFIPVENARGTVVLAHGITFTLYGSLKYLDLFRQRGWNTFLYDHRAHGRSGGKFKTYGFYERHDLKTVVDWAKTRCGPVGVLGESYGAATALQAAPLLPDLAFIIADCSFSDLPAMLAYRLKQDFGLGAFPFYQLASFITRWRAGFYLGAVSPLQSLSNSQIPILFTHGAEDIYTPTRMSQHLYDVYQGPKQLYLAPGAGHAEAYWRNPQEYDHQVGVFLQNCGF